LAANPVPGEKSPAIGRQSWLGGIFLAVFAPKTESRFNQTKFWRRRMDSRLRHGQLWPRKLREKIPRPRILCQFGAEISPGPGFSANLAPRFPPKLFSRPILLAGTSFSPGEAIKRIVSRKRGPADGYSGPRGRDGGRKRRPRGSESEGDHGRPEGRKDSRRSWRRPCYHHSEPRGTLPCLLTPSHFTSQTPSTSTSSSRPSTPDGLWKRSS
jgi:hypothetical protein